MRQSISKIVLGLAIIAFCFPAIGMAQIYLDLTVIVGNPDSTPLHVKYRGVADLPIWMEGVDWMSGFIPLATMNYAMAERLGGNFYFDWPYNFSEPQYDSLSSVQTLLFSAEDCPDGLFHLADFTVRMNLDSSYIGDTLDVLQFYTVNITDSLGMNLIQVQAFECNLAIDDVTKSEDTPALPDELILHGAYPNPFNAQTAISFYLPEASDVTIEIFDITGRRVNSFRFNDMSPGEHIVAWNGNNYLDRPASSGIYFYIIGAMGQVVTSRVALQK